MWLPYKLFNASVLVYSFKIAICVFSPFKIGNIKMLKILFVKSEIYQFVIANKHTYSNTWIMTESDVYSRIPY